MPPARLKISLCVTLLAVSLCGCVSKSKANAQARAAFIAGQQQAMVRMQQTQGPSVTVNGEVRNHIIPCTHGMTLAQAIVAAEYLGAKDPGQLIIVHNGIASRLDARQLLSGTDVPLQPGDIIQVISQPSPSTQ